MNLSDFRNLIPNYVIKIGEDLQRNGFEAFLVGGCIRDILLNKKPDDFDIATNATPEGITKIFPKSIPTGAKFGTITVIGESESGENFDVEVTTYRSEADYVGGRWPSKVEFAKTIQDDLSRRDFTINAIAFNIQQFDTNSTDTIVFDETFVDNKLLVDPFDGLSDLRNKVIRAVRDPYERFTEDGLRAVRACRLASQLNFEIEEKTFKAMKETNHITKLVSIERFREELVKLLLRSDKPSKGLYLLRDSGILSIFIPELLEGENVTQPQFHVDDVFSHSLKAVDEAEDSVKLAALFHDIGKPRTKTEDEKGIHFYGHDVVGAEMTEAIMRRLKFSNGEIDRTVRLVRWHMFYYPSADWRNSNPEDHQKMRVESNSKFQIPNSEFGWSDGAIRRLIQNVGGEDAIDDLMKLRIADASSNPKSDFSAKELDALSSRIADVRAKEMALKLTDLDITGQDLIENFNIQPGKNIGDILKHLLDLVIEDPAFNKKLDLLQLAKKYLERKE
jgi:poly(A) polymerase/tRNA nucleotidyltransferase (CCA-adding enzyme)